MMKNQPAPLKFFLDTHLGKAIVKQLAQKNIHAIHCEEVGLAEAPDHELLAYTAQNTYVLLSCDADFRELCYAWLEQDRHHYGIIVFSQSQHCQDVGLVIKIVLNIVFLVTSSNDLANQCFEAKDFE